MNVKQLINVLETEYNKAFEGVKVDLSHHHYDIRDTLRKHLPEGLDVEVWGVRTTSDYKKLLSYWIDMNEDNRYSHKKVGKVNRIHIMPIAEVDDNSTIEDLIATLKKREALERLESLENSLKKREEEIAKIQEDILLQKVLIKTLA